MAIVPATALRHLVFGGGGGRGWAHLGAVEALEDLTNWIPLVPSRTNKRTKSTKKKQAARSTPSGIQGVAGASVGAFVAMSLALGATHSQLRNFAQKSFSMESAGTEFAIPKVLNDEHTLPVEALRQVQQVLAGLREMSPERKNRIVAMQYLADKAVVVNGRFRKPKGVSKTTTDEMLEDEYYQKSMKEVLGTVGAELAKFRVEWTLKLIPRPRVLSPLEIVEELRVWLHEKVKATAPDFQVFTRDERMFLLYVANLMGEGGLIPGLALRTIVGSAIAEFGGVNPETFTFRDLMDTRGVELAVTGTHLARRRGELFSYRSTPDFAILPAVCISMSLPLLFKPVSVSLAGQGQYAGLIMPDRYKGHWSDGGMTNNLPIRAFARPGTRVLSPRTLGLALGDPIDRSSGDTVKTNLARIAREYLGVYADQPLNSQLEMFESDQHQVVTLPPTEGLHTLHVAYSEERCGPAMKAAKNKVGCFFAPKRTVETFQIVVDWARNAQSDPRFAVEPAVFEATARSQFQRLFVVVSPEPLYVRPFLDDGTPAEWSFTVDIIAGISASPSSWHLIEVKASHTAPFSPRQKQGHPLLERNGGTLINNREVDDEDWAPFKNRLHLQARKITVVRPKDLGSTFVHFVGHLMPKLTVPK